MYFFSSQEIGLVIIIMEQFMYSDILQNERCVQSDMSGYYKMKDASNQDATRLEVSTTILNKCWVMKDKPRKLSKWRIQLRGIMIIII